MALKGFFNKVKGADSDEGVDYVEIDGVNAGENDGKTVIKVETLTDFNDTERIQNELRKGNIVWTKIKPLREKDMTELRRAVDRLRKTAVAVNGDIAGIDEDYLVLTPEHVRVHRG